MKTGARLPRGIRWLGLMALGSVSLAVQAEEKIVLLTSWYAQAEQGGYYQAQATGLYKKYGLDVEIRSGGPQVNGMQLLLSKRATRICRASSATAASCCCKVSPASTRSTVPPRAWVWRIPRPGAL